MGSPKYIFVTGGVTSSLGKGVISASLGKLLQASGFSVTIQKFDPYINIDPGTMNPYEHGECYVTDDGAETDLDLGHYERFLDIATSQANNVTTGSIYNTVITKEREGAYLGKTVQVIPHITDEIKRRMFLLGNTKKYDIIITEIGGTIGDIESLPFVEAVRQVIWELGHHSAIVIHLTLVPFLKTTGELKTKPTQHSVKTLLESGIQPDILACRTEHHLPIDIRTKIALFCNVHIDSVIEVIDADTIYDVPMLMKKEKLDVTVLKKLKLHRNNKPNTEQWQRFLSKIKNPTKEINIGLVGKYVELRDAYKSIVEAFTHGGAANECKVNIKWVQSEHLLNGLSTNHTCPPTKKQHQGRRETKARQAGTTNNFFENVHGILVAPGFGERGIEGKIEAARYARENNIPYLGICLGMQCAVIEFARNVLNLKEAATTEITPDTPDPVIDLMEEQKNVTKKGGTMRLGAYPCEFKKDSKAYAVYGKAKVSERHRHRYEFNNKYIKKFQEAGMLTPGINPDNKLVEVIELKDHPWFISTQYHPELKSTVLQPHPLFVGFIKAAVEYAKNN
ncbi:MAG: CTP synthase [Cytophagales bacterium]|nr:CTP synthase [Cytophagales bacterium]